MNHKPMFLIISLFAIILLFVPFLSVNADDDYKQNKWYQKRLDNDDDNSDHHKRKRERKRDGNHFSSSIKIVKNIVYQDTCGECHFAYQPDLMPEASWTALMKNLDDHFGESIELDDDSLRTITDYLSANSVEKSKTKRGTKIIKSLKNKIPTRITEIPYILHQHHKISSNVFSSKSIGSFSNCSACHPTAEDGIYDDDNVKIPQ